MGNSENGNGKKKLTRKQITWMGICGVLISTAGGLAGGKYLYAETVVPVIKDTVNKETTKLYDSLNKPMKEEIKDIAQETELATLASMKTQVYLETSMEQEEKSTAEARWKHDSAIYMLGKKHR